MFLNLNSRSSLGKRPTIKVQHDNPTAPIAAFHCGGRLDQYYSPGQKTGGETHGIGWGGRNFHDGNGNGPAALANACRAVVLLLQPPSSHFSRIFSTGTEGQGPGAE